jgi:hypothetical protein
VIPNIVPLFGWFHPRVSARFGAASHGAWIKTPIASYHCSPRFTEPRATATSAPRSTTRRPSMYRAV